MTPRKSVVLLYSLVLLICCTLTLSAFAAAPDKGGPQTTEAKKVEPAAAPAPAAEKSAGAKVNLNTAPATELQKIKGIGSKIAAEIVAYREANGPFKTVEDLMKVKGIGQKKYDSIKDSITIE